MISSLSSIRTRRTALFVFTLCLVGSLRVDAPRAQPRTSTLAARGDSPAAFDGRCISRAALGFCSQGPNTAGMLPLPALPGERITGLGATQDFHHGLLAITGASIVSRPGAERVRGTIGANITPPAGATVIDAEGMSVYPGLIDGGTTLGLNEIGGVAVTQDSAESGVIQPDLRAAVAVKPDSELIPVAWFTGLTSAVSAPTGGLVPGQAALIQLAGWTPAELAYVDRLALQINIPNGAGSLDIGALLDQDRDADDDTPSVDEQMERLRELFAEARTYADQRDQAAQSDQRLGSYDPALEALIPYARREKPVIFTANSAAAILAAIDLAAELDVRAILGGGQEAWRVADEIADAGLGSLLSPLTRSPSDPYDPYDSVYATPLRLHEAGGLFGFQSNSGSGASELRFYAGMAVAFGLPPDVALRSVTLSTAEILGVDDQVGSLDVGKRADIIITDGDPLQAVSNVRYMFIAGQPVDIDDNKHTRLYRQYQQRLTGQ